MVAANTPQELQLIQLTKLTNSLIAENQRLRINVQDLEKEVKELKESIKKTINKVLV